jgi:hypothetical protein
LRKGGIPPRLREKKSRHPEAKKKAVIPDDRREEESQRNFATDLNNAINVKNLSSPTTLWKIANHTIQKR